MENFTSENDSIQSTVLESDVIMVTNVRTYVTKNVNKVIKKSKNKACDFIDKHFPKIIRPSSK